MADKTVIAAAQDTSNTGPFVSDFVANDAMDPTIGAGTTVRVLTVGAGSDTAFIQSIYGPPGHEADCTGIVGIVTGTPALPPTGVYLLPSEVHAMYSGLDLGIVLNRALHRPFAGIDDDVEREQQQDGEHEFFRSSLETTLDVRRLPGIFDSGFAAAGQATSTQETSTQELTNCS